MVHQVSDTSDTSDVFRASGGGRRRASHVVLSADHQGALPGICFFFLVVCLFAHAACVLFTQPVCVSCQLFVSMQPRGQNRAELVSTADYFRPARSLVASKEYACLQYTVYTHTVSVRGVC